MTSSADLWRARLGPPEQWRVLFSLEQHRNRGSRTTVAAVLNAQKVTDADLSDLFDRSLIAFAAEFAEVPFRRLPRSLRTRLRLQLTTVGWWTVYNDAGGQIRYALGQHTGPITLAKLFDDVVESCAAYDYDALIEQSRAGVLTIHHAEIGQLDESTIEAIRWLPEYDLLVALTAKGRTYVPH